MTSKKKAATPARRYTWKPDVPDHRDLIYSGGAPVVPRQVDMRPECPPVFDQGQLGSCTGNGWAFLLQFLLMQAGKCGALDFLSRLFIYFNERLVEGTVKSDDGAQIRDGAKTLRKYGACLEKLWPYVIKAFATKPLAAVYKAAGKLRMEHYMRCTEFEHFLHALADGKPVVFGFTVPESFEGDAIAKTGVMAMPQPGEKTVGGHCVVAVGYDLDRGVAIVRNSWGADWGDKGYFYMPLALIQSRKWSDDFWTGSLV